MNTHCRESSVWADVLSGLSNEGTSKHAHRDERTASTSPFFGLLSKSRLSGGRLDDSLLNRHTARIRILDFTERGIVVSWHDSTSCHYGDQRWIRAKARRTGVCALTGMPVSRGEYVYRPAQAPRPVNSGAMILASAVEAPATEK
jgi:hypothetical protein